MHTRLNCEQLSSGADGIGDWTTDGCNFTVVLPPDVAVCECDHLGNFGILVVRV